MLPVNGFPTIARPPADLNATVLQRDMLSDEVLALESNAYYLERQLLEVQEHCRVLQHYNTQLRADLEFCYSLPGVRARLEAWKGFSPQVRQQSYTEEDSLAVVQYREGFQSAAPIAPLESSRKAKKKRRPSLEASPSSRPLKRRRKEVVDRFAWGFARGRLDSFPAKVKAKLLAACESVTSSLTGQQAKYSDKRLQELHAILQNDPEPLQLLKNILQYGAGKRKDASITTAVLRMARKLAVAAEKLGFLPANTQKMSVAALQRRVDKALEKSESGEGSQSSDASDGVAKWDGKRTYRFRERAVAPIKSSETSGGPKGPVLEDEKEKQTIVRMKLSQSMKDKLLRGCQIVADRIPYAKELRRKEMRAVILYDPAPLQFLRAVNHYSTAPSVGDKAKPVINSASMRAVKKLAVWAKKEGILQRTAFLSIEALKTRLKEAMRLSEKDSEGQVERKAPRRQSQSTKNKLLEGCQIVVNRSNRCRKLRLKELRAVVLYDPEPLQFLRSANQYSATKPKGGKPFLKSVQMIAVKKLSAWAKREGLLSGKRTGENTASIAELENRLSNAIRVAEEEGEVEVEESSSDSSEDEGIFDVSEEQKSKIVQVCHKVSRGNAARIRLFEAIFNADPDPLQFLKNFERHSARSVAGKPRLKSLKLLSEAFWEEGGILTAIADDMTVAELLARVKSAQKKFSKIPRGDLVIELAAAPKLEEVEESPLPPPLEAGEILQNYALQNCALQRQRPSIGGAVKVEVEVGTQSPLKNEKEEVEPAPPVPVEAAVDPEPTAILAAPPASAILASDVLPPPILESAGDGGQLPLPPPQL